MNINERLRKIHENVKPNFKEVRKELLDEATLDTYVKKYLICTNEDELTRYIENHHDELY